MWLLISLACNDPAVTEAATDTTTAATGTHLITSQGPGLILTELDGTPVQTWTWADLAGEPLCAEDCDPQEVEVDEDGLVTAYASFSAGSDFPGGVVRLRPEGDTLVVDWHHTGLSFPHDLARDPGTGLYVVADTSAHRLVWLDPDTGDQVSELDGAHPDWDDFYLPNGLDLVRHQGRTYVLMSSRGSSDSLLAMDGRLVLWDVTDPDSPERVWIFPSDGTLSMPHGPLLRPHDGGWMLVYAHTQSVELDGLSALGSLGLGWTDTLTTRPTYLGDGLLPEALGPMAYHRGVELAVDGTLYLAESIDLFRGGQGRLTTASLPTLSPAGLSGAWDADHSQLAWFTLDDAVVLDGDLDNLFQVRLFTPPGPAD